MKTLIACVLLVLVLGTLHAFSVLLMPITHVFDVSRSDASFTYSLALLALTVGVRWGPVVYYRYSPAYLLAVIGCGAVLGLGIAAIASSIYRVWLGYGILFGFVNGLGYGYALQLAASINPVRQGVLMGVVTAGYALGAAIAPGPLMMLLASYPLSISIWGLALSVCLITLLVSYLTLSMPVLRGAVTGASIHQINRHRFVIRRLRWGFGFAVIAGLMVMGHALSIAQQRGLTESWLMSAPMILAICNLLGSLIGGWLVDRISFRTLLIILPLMTAVSLTVLSVSSGTVVLIGLAGVGAIYGATIAIYPAGIAQQFGQNLAGDIYGRVFIAWGVAGLIGPWFAGMVMDVFFSYTPVFIAAAIITLMSVVVIWPLERLSQC